MTERYVVDTSVVIQRLIVEKNTPQVRCLFAQMNQGLVIVVPEFCLLECANVLWKQVRFQGMPQPTAEHLLVELLELPLQVMPVGQFMPRALQIGLAAQLAVYDSLYLALAENLNCALITVDQKQAEVTLSLQIPLKAIADFS
ncbi:MAG: type II toxin-antitoxin system VapC family toxin [Cyanobacteriota bacterium]|nr:type II toxin-antitoxin system VapC family toxin [Cyanobacteriota bacterium]